MVTPLYKSGDKCSVRNDRPFSLLCVIVSGRIKGAACVTNVMFPCDFICIPVVLTLCHMNLIKN